MRSRRPPTKSLALLVLLGLGAAGCGNRAYLHAEAVDGAGVRVVPSQVVVAGEKLWVRLMVTNDSGGTLVINRDAMTAHPLSLISGALVAGTTVNRTVGKTTWQGVSYALPPGGARTP